MYFCVFFILTLSLARSDGYMSPEALGDSEMIINKNKGAPSEHKPPPPPPPEHKWGLL
jgi:hypothetical protein